jgi:hypothetical protein
MVFVFRIFHISISGRVMPSAERIIHHGQQEDGIVQSGMMGFCKIPCASLISRWENLLIVPPEA